MDKLEIIILGSASGKPEIDRSHSSIALRRGSDIWLLDAGEGVTSSMLRHHVDPEQVTASMDDGVLQVTDADLVLKRLDPAFFAGGRMRLNAAAAHAAIEESIARPMGLSGPAAERRRSSRCLCVRDSARGQPVPVSATGCG